MIDIFHEYKQIFWHILQEIAHENNVQLNESDFDKFIVEPSKDKTHGSLACNAAMTLSKIFGQCEKTNNPRKLAAALITKIEKKKSTNFHLKNIEKLEIAGPGFINIFIKNEAFYQILGDLLQKKQFLFQNIGKSEKINLEYASPNPTGPIHVGHTRGAIYGDVLATLLQKTGFDVLKEYYVNDAGNQIKNLLISALMRYAEATGELPFWERRYDEITGIFIDEGSGGSKTPFTKMIDENDKLIYPGEYLKDIGKKLKEKYKKTLIEEYNNSPNGKTLNDILEKIREFVIQEMINMIVADLKTLGIEHNSIFREKENLHDTNKIETIIKILENAKDEEGRNIIYLGKLEAPKTEKGVGALPEGYSDETQTLFRSTSFGDDQDRVVKKADGTPTYFAADLAYIQNKLERSASKMIMPLGFDHAGYIKRMQAAVKAIKKALKNDERINQKAELKIILCQMVKFVKNGEPLKMSKRSGNFITAREVIDQLKKAIGGDEKEAEKTSASILRFIMLTRKNDAPFDFDLNKVIEQSKDNPIFYVQYAHARCCSVLRNLANENLLPNIENEQIDISVFSCLKDDAELDLIKKIATFPRLIEVATTNFEPHRIAFYLQELSAIFHSLWNKGVENPNLKFIIKDDLDSTKARIYLLMALKIIIQSGLAIFDIKAMEEMR